MYTGIYIPHGFNPYNNTTMVIIATVEGQLTITITVTVTKVM
jgi:hypothetical protein